MKTYNYFDSVCEDVKEYINNEINAKNFADRDELEEYLNDVLFCEDSVTGNASGSYTFNSYVAEENLCHNLELLAEACEGFGNNIDILKDGAEACDVTIRCYLLSQCISAVLDEIEDSLIFAEDETED